MIPERQGLYEKVLYKSKGARDWNNQLWKKEMLPLTKKEEKIQKKKLCCIRNLDEEFNEDQNYFLVRDSNIGDTS